MNALLEKTSAKEMNLRFKELELVLERTLQAGTNVETIDKPGRETGVINIQATLLGAMAHQGSRDSYGLQ